MTAASLGNVLHHTCLAAATHFPDVDRLQLPSPPASFLHFFACSAEDIATSRPCWMSLRDLCLCVSAGGLTYKPIVCCWSALPSPLEGADGADNPLFLQNMRQPIKPVGSRAY